MLAILNEAFRNPLPRTFFSQSCSWCNLFDPMHYMIECGFQKGPRGVLEVSWGWKAGETTFLKTPPLHNNLLLLSNDSLNSRFVLVWCCSHVMWFGCGDLDSGAVFLLTSLVREAVQSMGASTLGYNPWWVSQSLPDTCSSDASSAATSSRSCSSLSAAWRLKTQACTTGLRVDTKVVK